MNSAPRYTAQYSQTNSPRPVAQSAAISGHQGQGYYKPNFGQGATSNQNQLHGTASMGQSVNFGPRGQTQYFNRSVRPTYFLSDQGQADIACDVYDQSVNDDCDLFDFDCAADVTTELASDCCIYDGDHDHNEFIPLFINGMKTTGIRDTGCRHSVMVSDALVSPNQIIQGQFAQMQGVFDQNTWHQVPVANITLKSPRFGSNKEIVVQAAVCVLPNDINCLTGNNLFKQFPELSDIVSVRLQRSSGLNTSTGKLQAIYSSIPRLTENELTTQKGHLCLV